MPRQPAEYLLEFSNPWSAGCPSLNHFLIQGCESVNFTPKDPPPKSTCHLERSAAERGQRGVGRLFDPMYCIDLSIPFSSSSIRADLPKIGISAEGKTWRKRNVSPTLVFDYRATRRTYLEIGDARAHDPLLDNGARHRRIGPRRRHYSHGFAREKRTISSGWPDFFYTGRDPGSLHLL